MRKIIHIDMDCFYAAVEIRDNPALAGKPVAVGGARQSRGVLTTCNYVARNYGIHSAMSTAAAMQLCPELVLLPVNMAKYKAVSARIQQIYQQFTSLVEPLSLDEAYLDVTDATCYSGSATWIAEAIRQAIYKKEKLTASAGVAPNKFLAKVASDWNKPNGLMVVAPNQVNTFVKYLPISKIVGVGKATQQKLEQLNIHTCGDCQKMDFGVLKTLFGQFGQQLYQLSRGIDDRPVKSKRQRKSVSVEHTFASNLHQLEECLMHVNILHPTLVKRVQPYHQNIVQQYIRLKFNDFTTTTHQRRSSGLNINLFKDLLAYSFYKHRKPIRLIGLGVRVSDNASAEQQAEFDFYASS